MEQRAKQEIKEKTSSLLPSAYCPMPSASGRRTGGAQPGDFPNETIYSSRMRIIVHVDMDAFYAAVEERLNPALRALPVVVGADPKEGKGRGVVMTANYSARKFGIHSALPISRAWRLAEAARRRGEPAMVFIQPNIPLYREVSARIMRLLEHRADTFEEA